MAEDRAERCLLVVFGVPGAGKSTLARQLAAQASAAQRSSVSVELVEFDSLAPDSNALFSPEAWKESRQAALRALDAALEAPVAQPGGLRLVIADDTMHLRSMRHHCYSLARRRSASYVQVYLRCPLDLAQRRNAGRPPAQRVPPEVVASTAAALEDLSSSSAPAWERACTITIDAEAPLEGGGGLWGQAWAAWGRPLPPPPDQEALEAERKAAQEATAASAAHQADLAMRRALSGALGEASGLGAEQRAAAGPRLNEARRQQLAELARRLQQSDGAGSVAELAQAAQAAFLQECQDVLSAGK